MCLPRGVAGCGRSKSRRSSTAADCIFVTYFVTKLLANGTHHLYTLHRDLRSDTVSGNYTNFIFHNFLPLLHKNTYSYIKALK